MILDAARSLLAEQGFAALGVNAVARRAGCDKQLIYRYFGGLEGLIDRLGEALTHWVRDALAPLLGYLDALRSDAVMQRIVAWEIAGPSPMVGRLADARSAGLADWVARQRGDLAPPHGIDAPAANALLVAAVQHVVLTAGVAGGFGGRTLAADVDWDRLRGTLRRIIRRSFAP